MITIYEDLYLRCLTTRNDLLELRSGSVRDKSKTLSFDFRRKMEDLSKGSSPNNDFSVKITGFEFDKLCEVGGRSNEDSTDADNLVSKMESIVEDRVFPLAPAKNPNAAKKISERQRRRNIFFP